MIVRFIAQALKPALRGAAVLAALLTIPGARAQTGAGAELPQTVFLRLCADHSAQPDAVAAAARAEGFVPATRNVPGIQPMEHAIFLERLSPPRLVLVVGSGRSAVSKSIPGTVPVLTCALVDTTGAWDVRGFARTFVGLDPLFDQEGLALYSYADRPGGRALDDSADLPRMLADANTGTLRAVVASRQGTMSTLAWTVMQVPAMPLTLPASVDHAAQPFAPCTWQPAPYGKSMALMCPVSGQDAPVRQSAGPATPDTPDQARAGGVGAMLALVGLYAQGPDALHDPVMAREWARRAAEAGSGEGAFDLALALETGVGGPADPAAARTWYAKAVTAGLPAARVNLAAMMVAAGEASAAIALLQPAAEAGDPAAAFAMGHMAENGIGGPADMARAQAWFGRAGEASINAQIRLGRIADEGLGGTPRDPAAALVHYGNAAQRQISVAEALAAISGMINGASRDGLQQWARAAESSPQQAVLLGLYLATPARADYAAAVPLLKSAAARGVAMAALRLARMMATGTGLPKDTAAALDLYRKALDFKEAARFNTDRHFINRETPPHK